METGIEIIEKERERQINEEGYSYSNDDKYQNGDLAQAAAVYSLPLSYRMAFNVSSIWPWGKGYYKPCDDEKDIQGRIHELSKAGALIAAEIDRLQRIKK